MSIHDLSSNSRKDSNANAEFCIIGGGMAGLFIARRLARAGRSVVVLESGGHAFEQQSHELNRINDVHGRYSRALDGRYRGLGGSSSRWGGRIMPIHEHDTAPRPYLELEGWPFPYSDLRPYAAEVEDVFGLPHGPFGTKALANVQLDRAFPPDDPDFRGRLAKWAGFQRCNLATIWRRELAALPSLEIVLGATVADFDIDPERGLLRAVGARGFGGHGVRVRAERFVLAAGTIEATRLLLWLDAQTGNRAFKSTSALGRYFQDHLKAEVAIISRLDQSASNRLFGYHFIGGTRRSLHLDLTMQAQEADGTASAFAYVAMNLADSHLAHIKTLARSLQLGRVKLGEATALLADLPLVMRSAFWRLFLRQVYMPADVELGVQIAIEQRPSWDNHIRLSSQRDAFGLPMAAVHWQPTDQDEATFRAVAQRLRHYWSRNQLDHLHPLTWRAGNAGDPTRFSDLAEPYAHPSGSTRMGTNPGSSVVDPDLVCHAVPNLSVASASVFPSAGSANPTFTILQLALRHADWLLATSRAPVSARGTDQANSTVLATAMAPTSASATRTTSASSI